MQKVLVMLVVFSVLFSFSVAFASDTGMVAKKPSPEEIATYQKTVGVARERDHDKTVVFTKTSESGTCYYWELDNKLDEMLIKSPDVVVDKKEFLAPAYVIAKISQNSGNVYNKCTVTLVVHYHKIKVEEMKK